MRKRLSLFADVAPLRERDFRLLFVGQAVSHYGDRLVPVALAFAVLELTGSAADLGYVLAAQAVPMVAFVLLGGVWADRLPRQLVMLASDGVRAVAEGVLAALLLTGHAKLWELIVLQAVYGTATAFFSPAATGVVPKTVPPAQLQQANALVGLSRSAAAIAGPLTAGLIVAGSGPGTAIAVDAATFVASGVALASMRVGREPLTIETTVLRDLAAGWAEFSSRGWLWTSVGAFAVLNMVGLGALFVLGPVVAKASLGGATSWGIVLAAAGVGSLVGGVFALRWAPRRPLTVGFLLMCATFPALLALLAWPAPLWLVAAAAALAQVALVYDIAVWTTALQEHVPDDALARVSSYDWLVSYALQPLGLAVMGPLAGAIGVSETLFVAAAVVAVALGAAAAAPSVRGLGVELARAHPGEAQVAVDAVEVDADHVPAGSGRNR